MCIHENVKCFLGKFSKWIGAILVIIIIGVWYNLRDIIKDMEMREILNQKNEVISI